MPARRSPGSADLSPARLAGVHLVRAYDPARPSFEAWVRVGGLAITLVPQGCGTGAR